jgi:hypothetical protein
MLWKQLGKGPGIVAMGTMEELKGHAHALQTLVGLQQFVGMGVLALGGASVMHHRGDQSEHQEKARQDASWLGSSAHGGSWGFEFLE